MASIQKREGGKWIARVSHGRHPHTGKHIIRSKTFTTKGEASAWARKEEDKREKGAVRFSREPLGKFLERWLEAKQKGRKRLHPRTLYDYQGIIRRYIMDPPPGAPVISTIPLHKLQKEAVADLYQWLHWEHGLAPRTIEYLHAILSGALAWAGRNQLVAGNAAKDANESRPVAAESDAVEARDYSANAMTAEQARAFLAAAELDRWAALWYVLLHGGLRPSEAYALTWDDLKGDTLRVRRALTRQGVEGWRLTPPKTKHGPRDVTLPGSALELLREERRTQAARRLKLGPEWPGHGFIFTTETGEPLQHPNISRRHFRPIMEAAGLGEWEGEGRRRKFRPAFRLYDLRHTSCTLLLADGEQAKVVSARMGHHSVAFTLDNYGHVLPGQETTAAARLEALLDRRPDAATG